MLDEFACRRRRGGFFMSVTKAIGPHLPFLRRFARALTGRQASGDAYVVATLEALVADQAALGDLDHVRIGLYKIFVRIWQGVPAGGMTYMKSIPSRWTSRGWPEAKEASTAMATSSLVLSRPWRRSRSAVRTMG